MADVAKNLGRTSPDNVSAIAVYIAGLSAESGSRPVDAKGPVGKTTGQPTEVAAIFAGACARCHESREEIGPSKALPLSSSTAVRQTDSANAVRVVLNGIQDYRVGGGPYMPAFDGVLTDEQIAAVVRYVRAATDQKPWTDVEAQIAKSKLEGGRR